MRNFFYAIVSITLIGFGSFTVLKSHAAEIDRAPEIINTYPYQIIETKPSGEQKTFSGVSSNMNPIKIIPDLKVSYYSEDKISTFPDPKLGFGSTIKIRRAPVISIKDGKRSKQYRSWSTTVGDLFAEQGIEIGADDKVNTSLTAQIFDGSTIFIIRVAITNVVETATIAFQIQNQDDPNLDYGKKRTVAGVLGEKKLTYLVRREDGEEVSRTLANTEITKQPVAQINYTGTKVTVLSSVSGRATMTPISTYVVSPNYPRGTVIRITNRSNRVRIFETVNATWGTASAPDGVVLDLAPTFLSQLKCPSSGCSSVLVEEIKQ